MQRPIYYHGSGMINLNSETFCKVSLNCKSNCVKVWMLIWAFSQLIKCVLTFYMMFKTITAKWILNDAWNGWKCGSIPPEQFHGKIPFISLSNFFDINECINNAWYCQGFVGRNSGKMNPTLKVGINHLLCTFICNHMAVSYCPCSTSIVINKWILIGFFLNNMPHFTCINNNLFFSYSERVLFIFCVQVTRDNVQHTNNKQQHGLKMPEISLLGHKT